MKRIRAEIDKSVCSARTILAEANQWPDDVRIYYGDGDECHMAFHFPVDAAHVHGAAPGRPPTHHRHHGANAGDSRTTASGALFLRNHDELTLEMVTDEERDYMYLAYSADPAYAYQCWYPSAAWPPWSITTAAASSC